MWAYGGVVMAALAAAALWTSADAPMLDVFAILAPYLFGLGVLWSLFAWWGFDRRWPLYALAAAALIAAPRFFPPSVQGLARGDDSAIALGFHNDWGKDEYADRVGAWANEAKTDALAFIELTPERYGLIAPRIKAAYPFHIEKATGSRMALFSPYPVKRVEAPLAPAGPDLLIGDIALPESKGARTLRVALVHFRRPWPFDELDRQRTQSLVLSRILSDLGDVDVVIGDFNAAPWTGQIRRLSEYTEMPMLPLAGGTWPVAAPPFLRLPIDLVLVREGARGRMTIARETGSEHRPLIARVRLPE
jgi:endonuclease/exonuclease/phosphatase (EEP) superfamily protein YafD